MERCEEGFEKKLERPCSESDTSETTRLIMSVATPWQKRAAPYKK